MVYAWHCPINGIKIGKADSLDERMAKVRTDNPNGAKRVFVELPGGYRAERYVHKKLAKHRREGEFFAPVEEVWSYLLLDVHDDRGFAEAAALDAAPKQGSAADVVATQADAASAIRLAMQARTAANDSGQKLTPTPAPAVRAESVIAKDEKPVLGIAKKPAWME